ncbi:hypothetical protein MJM45_31805, partial [Salmonella enterica subsp. enterica serovar Kentucky]|nr:hypothetical protein [Salmonella enterica subsp. enterica serovar Kentucky]
VSVGMLFDPLVLIQQPLAVLATLAIIVFGKSIAAFFLVRMFGILLGMIFLGERFRRMQWLAVILAVCGVLVQLWTFGSLPIIAL